MEKKEKIILIVLILLFSIVAVSLRIYGHNDLLHFQSDQSRDALIIDEGIANGIKELPLLGPQARGSELLLGPIFYYFQYLAAFFGGNAPNILAMPDLIFSLLFIPLSYIFFRTYFTFRFSLALAGLGALSLFLVEYSRFAWNPNSLPFFTLLMATGLLKAFETKMTVSTGWWMAAVLALAVAMQLHFIFFLAGPAIFIIYLAYIKRRLSIKLVAVAGFIIFLLFSPVIYSEHKTNGSNTKAFFQTIREKGGNGEKHNILEKIFRNYQETSRAFWIIVTGDQHGDMISTRMKNQGFSKFLCDKKCRDNIPYSLIAMLAFGFGAMTLVKKAISDSLEERKKIFIVFVSIWSSVVFAVLTLVAYQISPRFYLTIVPPFLVIAGLLIQRIGLYFKNYKVHIVSGIILFLMAHNAYQDIVYLRILSSAAHDPNIGIERDLILLRDNIITLEQLKVAANFIADNEKNNKSIIFVADNRYARSISYLLKHNEGVASVPIKLSDFEPDGKEHYFVIKTFTNTQDKLKSLDGYDFIKQKEIGTISIFKLALRQ